MHDTSHVYAQSMHRPCEMKGKAFVPLGLSQTPVATRILFTRKNIARILYQVDDVLYDLSFFSIFNTITAITLDKRLMDYLSLENCPFIRTANPLVYIICT